MHETAVSRFSLYFEAVVRLLSVGPFRWSPVYFQWFHKRSPRTIALQDEQPGEVLIRAAYVSNYASFSIIKHALTIMQPRPTYSNMLEFSHFDGNTQNPDFWSKKCPPAAETTCLQ